MVNIITGNAPLTVALALLAGMLAQVLARHLRLPGIVLLLAAGVLLGPDAANVIQPASLGSTLHVIVGFGVAVILFEGGLNLDVRRLRGEGAVIRRLVTLGAAITAAGASAVAHLLMHWDWGVSVLFGTLVMVTGPTVVTPLVRRIGVMRKLRTILEAEGVFVDAIGALVAAVTLEVVLQPSGSAVASGVTGLAIRLGTGLGVGLVGGAAIALLLRFRRVVPDGLENVFTLSAVVALYQGASSLVGESGILAVVIAGMVVGNVRSPVRRELLEFKEQLTTLLIGLLFVLLAADVRLSEVLSLGRPGLLTVLALVAVVRPIAVAASTAGSSLTWKERGFLAWVAPRGIVAAAIASLAAQALDAAGIPGGHELRALVFLVIALTVVVQGLPAGLVARLLGVRRPADLGYVVLGANGLGRAIGRALLRGGDEVVLLDGDPIAARRAEEEGFRVVFGNDVTRSPLRRTEPEIRKGFVAVSPNEGVNLLVARTVIDHHRLPLVYVAVDRSRVGVEPATVEAAGARTLFGGARDLGPWIERCETKRARTERWRADQPPDGLAAPDGGVLALLHRRGGEHALVDEKTRFRAGDEVDFLVALDREEAALSWFRDNGWTPVSEASAGPA